MRVYLFRKLWTSPTDLQLEVRAEAISEVLDQVLGGRISTVFSCGRIPINHAADPSDVVIRILDELFTRIYELETNMEVHVSVRYVQLNGETNDLVVNLKGCNRRSTRDHFVATSHGVHTYIARVMDKVAEGGDCPHLIFTVHVKQTNGDQLRKFCGRLQLVHLQQVTENSPSLKSDTPLDTLINLFQVLANSPKTHIRYYNIRLTRLLNQLMGNGSRTVIINYTDPPEGKDDLVAPAPTPSFNSNTSFPAEVWRRMLRQERAKYRCLRNKALGLVVDKEELERFLQSLEADDSSEENILDGDFDQKLEQKMLEIRSEAEMSIEKLKDVQMDIDYLTERNCHLEQQLYQKNSQLNMQSNLMLTINLKLRDQTRKFQDKIAEYTDKFQEMWERQSLDMQYNEQRQLRQLTKLFDSQSQTTQRWWHRKTSRLPQKDADELHSQTSPVEDPSSTLHSAPSEASAKRSASQPFSSSGFSSTKAIRLSGPVTNHLEPSHTFPSAAHLTVPLCHLAGATEPMAVGKFVA
ncbi:GM26642 [Drosophila sechellia]|uniref:GM26642 n=2 Tax=Drosophila sechellia TaxID=7238 RepID=B4HHN4_DROSE|nr:GM26642 [Drosophila sechellia]